MRKESRVSTKYEMQDRSKSLARAKQKKKKKKTNLLSRRKL